MLDARYEKVRIDGVIRSQAVLIASGINREGRRQMLGVELANRESASSWKEFVRRLKERGLHGVEFVVSDDHEGLRKAVAELLTEAAWQRCYVHFLRNALDHLPRKADDDCLQELRWIYERRDLKGAQTDLSAWLKRWEQRYPKLTDWAEEHIGQTLTFYRLPRQHHKHLKSTNLLERVNEEITSDERASFAASPTSSHACGWFELYAPRSTKPGWRTTAPRQGPAARAEEGGNEACRLTSPTSWPCLSLCTT